MGCDAEGCGHLCGVIEPPPTLAKPNERPEARGWGSGEGGKAIVSRCSPIFDFSTKVCASGVYTHTGGGGDSTPSPLAPQKEFPTPSAPKSPFSLTSRPHHFGSTEPPPPRPQGCIRRGARGGLKGEGGGGVGWDPPPPRVPLWSLSNAGQIFLCLDPLGAEGAEAKFWLSASNIQRGERGGGESRGGTPPPPAPTPALAWGPTHQPPPPVECGVVNQAVCIPHTRAVRVSCRPTPLCPPALSCFRVSTARQRAQRRA